MSFPCIKCKKASAVIDTRVASFQDGTRVRRRRECLNKKCKARWTTVEMLATKTQDGSFTAIRPEDLKKINGNVAKKLHALAYLVQKGKL